VAKKTKPPELVGLAEAAELLGIPSSSLVTRRQRRQFPRAELLPPRPFPPTIAELRCGPIWLKADVVEYADEAERRRKLTWLQRADLDRENGVPFSS
jgi:hypothetical protein